MKEDGEISRESVEKQVVGEGISKNAEHSRTQGQWQTMEETRQQMKGNSQKMKDIARPKTTISSNKSFRSDPGLAVDLLHMPSTCPCRASIQGSRGSSQY